MMNGNDPSRSQKSADPLGAVLLSIYLGWFHLAQSMVWEFGIVSACYVGAFKLAHEKEGSGES